MSWLHRHLLPLLFLAAAVAAGGCAPKLGDECTDSLDCATDGSRVCDNTQPDGYCLMPGCRADECPEEGICIRFGEEEGARTFCMAHCGGDGDCRNEYECVFPSEDGELSITIEDDNPGGPGFCIEAPAE